MINKSLPLIFGALITLAFSQFAFSEGDHKGGHGHDKHEKKADSHGEAGGHEHSMGAHWMSPKAAAARVNPIKSGSDSIARGGKIYANYCSSCHGDKAMGDGPAAASLNPKPTDLKAMSGGHPDGDFAWKIANGRGAMPAWQGVLNENQIWDLVNFIQNLKDQEEHDHSKHSHKKKHSH